MTTSARPLVRLGSKPGVLEYLRSLWARREFAIAIPTAQLQAEHRNTVLGNVWHLLNPMLQAAIYYLIFAVLLDTSRGVDNTVAFIVIGVFVFHFTSKSITKGAKSITSNEGLMRAIRFPRAILPLSVVLSEFLAFGYSIATLFAVAALTSEPFALSWLLLVPILLLQLLFNIGAAFFVARLASHFIDVQQVLPFLLRLWFYLSGVIFPASRYIDEFPQFSVLLYLNPAYCYIELMRGALMREFAVTGALWGAAAAWAVASLVLGFLFFRSREHEYGRA